MAQLDFDPTTVEAEREPGALPAGKYIAVINKSDLVPTKAGDGTRLALELTIVEGEYKNRRVWDSLNIQNRSTQAVEISQRRMKSISLATGNGDARVTNSEVWHNKPMVITVSADPGDPGRNRKPSNEIEGYSAKAPGQAAPVNAPVESLAPSAESTPGFAGVAATATASGSPKPWEN